MYALTIKILHNISDTRAGHSEEKRERNRGDLRRERVREREK